MKNKFNIQDKVMFCGVEVEIKRVEFGKFPTPHYGFVSKTDSGWCPISILDKNGVRTAKGDPQGPYRR